MPTTPDTRTPDQPNLGDLVRYIGPHRGFGWWDRAEKDSVVVDRNEDNGGQAHYTLYVPVPDSSVSGEWYAPASDLRIVARATYERVS